MRNSPRPAPESAPTHTDQLPTLSSDELAQAAGGWCWGGWNRNQYVVQKGDTLTAIARRYHMPLGQLIGFNRQIKNPDLIYPGQQVNVGQRRGFWRG